MLTAACAQIDPSMREDAVDAQPLIGCDCSLLPPAELSADKQALLPLPTSQSMRLSSAPEWLLCWDNGEGLSGFAGSSRRHRSVSPVGGQTPNVPAGHQSRYFSECVAFYAAASPSVEAQWRDGRGQSCYSSEMSTKVAPEGRKKRRGGGRGLRMELVPARCEVLRVATMLVYTALQSCSY